MERNELKNILQHPYQRNLWIKTLQFLAGQNNSLTIFVEPKEISLSSKQQTSLVRSLVQLGSLTTADGVDLPIFEIELQEKVKIEYNRVGVNELIKSHILKDAFKGAIATYYYNGSLPVEWRFSFISKHGASDFFAEADSIETTPKKYTYIFGTSEHHRTALERLFNLKQSSFNLEDFFEAFNVEPVSQNFFKEYKNFYLDFAHHLATTDNRKIFEVKNKNAEEVELDIRNFVKRLLGRVVFLYFLQKKNWLAASNKNYEDGDANFMDNLFNGSLGDIDKEQFYSHWLSKLFFNALNLADRPNDSFELPNGKSVWIPFLNGGLFEEEQEPSTHRNIVFPAHLFETLFEFFNGYNFTIYENSPEDHTVAVDPEMLGHIFENLLEDNSDKGAFYTPKEIVHYMTQESLIEYLLTHTAKSRDELENLIKNQFANSFSKDELRSIDKLIDKVKICDPAIGSGAFPMGLLQEMFSLKAFIHYQLGHDDWSPAIIKQKIIQNSIYGVDLEAGAVDIARLRFWLSLVVDEPTPKPLPNLDYKIMQGNSLVESFEGIDLSKISKGTNVKLAEVNKDIFGNIVGEPEETYGKEGIEDTILDLTKTYFTASVTEKTTLRNKINNLINEFIEFNIEIRGTQLFRLIKELKAVKNKTKKINKELEELQKKYELIEVKSTKLKEIQKSDDKPYFLWSLFFKDVFDNGGFDIVIGNPPYLRIQGIREANAMFADFLTKNFKSATGSFDLYAPFTEKGFDIMKDDGILNFIMPVKWTNAAFGKGLRQVISDRNAAHKIISFGAYQAFNASTYTGLQWFKNNSSALEYVELNKSLKTKDQLKTYFSNLKNESFSKIAKTKLTATSWPLMDSTSANILDKMTLHKRKVNDLFDKIFQGIATSKDSVYFLSDCIENGNTITGFSKELDKKVTIEKGILKPLLKGDDVHKYENIIPKRYVVFPYIINIVDSKNTIDLISENELIKKYPLAHSYLKENEVILREREKGRFNIDGEWFQFGRKQGIHYAEYEKLIAPDISMGGNFAYDKKGEFYSTTTNYGYIKKESTQESYLFYLALFNSKVLWWYLVNTGTVLANGYFRFKPDYIKPFPVPDITNVSSIDTIETLALYIIELRKLPSETKLDDFVPNTHLIEAFEEIINALFFELYFPKEFEKSNIKIHHFAKKSFPKIDIFKPDHIQSNIQKSYKIYREKKDELRNQIMLMKIELKDLLMPILTA